MLLLPLVLLLGLSWPRPGQHPTTHIAHSPQKPLSLSPPPYWSQCHQLAHLRPRRPVTSCPATAPVSPRSLCCCLLLLLLLPAACCLLRAALFAAGTFSPRNTYLPASSRVVAFLFCLLFSSTSLPNAARQQGTRTHAVRQENKSAAGIGDIEPRSARKREMGGCRRPFRFTKSRESRTTSKGNATGASECLWRKRRDRVAIPRRHVELTAHQQLQ